MKLKTFKELIVWQRSFELANFIFKCSISFLHEHRSGLTSQLLKSSVSLPSNIAEGYNRGSRKEYLYFLRVAHGSLAELETQFLIANAQGFFKGEDAHFIDKEIDEIGKMMNAIIAKLKVRDYRGVANMIIISIILLIILVIFLWRATKVPYTSYQARLILEKHCLELTGEKPSTCSIKPKKDISLNKKETWLTNSKFANPYKNPRYKAYLKAYLEIAGNKFYGSGIPLIDGNYMIADKGVMKILLEEDIVYLKDCKFELSQKGQSFIV